MEVYIEYVILDNLIINSILIYLTCITLKNKINKYRIMLGSVVGTIFAIVMPFISLNSFLLFIIKMCVGLIIVLSFCKFKIKDIILSYTLFITYTFLMGGMCFGLMYLLNLNVSANGFIIYNFNIPLSIIILAIFIYFLILKKFVTYKKNILNFSYLVEVKKDDKTIKLQGFLDTGNQIYDDYGNPIVVISKSSFIKAFPTISLIKIATNNVNNYDLKNSKYIVISTANATTKMLTFKCDKMVVFDNKKCNEYNNITIGVSNSNFNKKFDCILHTEYV